jgi:hypothetical protein
MTPITRKQKLLIGLVSPIVILVLIGIINGFGLPSIFHSMLFGFSIAGTLGLFIWPTKK